MICRIERKETVWIDLEKPTHEEIRETMREVGIGERIENELLEPTPLSLVATEPDAALLIFHLLSPGETDGEAKDQEVDIVVGRRYVVTVHYEVIPPLRELLKHLEASGLLGSDVDIETDTLLEAIFARLFQAMRDHAHHTAKKLEYIERQMFAGRERDSVRSISNVNRDFLHLEAALAGQEEPLERFLEASERRAFFGASFNKRAARIMAEREQVSRLVATHRAVATELRETNAALLNARQNQIIAVLTVVNFVLLPAVLIATLFELNVPGIPLADNPHGFWIVLALMVTVSSSLAVYFSRKRWFSV